MPWAIQSFFSSHSKVRKQSGQNILALKEVNFHNPAFGKDKRSRDSSVEKIVSELTIIKEQVTLIQKQLRRPSSGQSHFAQSYETCHFILK